MTMPATFNFKDDAENWWRTVKAARSVTRMKWKEFIQIFYQRHFPRAKREKMAKEFSKLEYVRILNFKFIFIL